MKAEVKRQLFPYAIVVMLAFIGFSLPLPILPEMFLDVRHSMLPTAMSVAERTVLLGLMLMAYPLGQFLGSPFLGKFSDQYGRKRVIQFSLLGSTLGYVVVALGVFSHHLGVMFWGFFLCGLCEGNISIAQSAIADLTTKQTRSRYFGWLNFFINAGFIIGPLIGGQLSHSSWIPGLTFATPFWAAAVLTVIGMVIIAICAQETLKTCGVEKLDLFPSFRTVLKFPGIKRYYIAAFFLSMGFFFFFRFVTVYAEREFNLSTAQMGYLLAYNSLFFAVALVVMVPFFEKRLTPAQSTALFSLFLALSYVLFLIPRSAVAMLYTVPFVGLFLAMTITFDAVMISTVVDERHQGQAMGVLVSIQVIAEILTSLTGGFLGARMAALPILVGTVMCVICSGILFPDMIRRKGAQ